MNQITRTLDEIDQRRGFAPRACPCCGETKVIFDDTDQSEQARDLRRHFGGVVCEDCRGGFIQCHVCGQVTDEKSDRIDDCCAACDQSGPRPYPGEA